MALRVTASDVKDILDVDTTLLSDAQILIFAGMANVLVDTKCTDSALTDTQLTYIEQLLAAHFCCLKNRRTIREEAGSVAESFQHVEDLALDSTEYGQMAMVLDTSGALKQLNNSKGKVTISFSSINMDYDTLTTDD